LLDLLHILQNWVVNIYGGPHEEWVKIYNASNVKTRKYRGLSSEGALSDEYRVSRDGATNFSLTLLGIRPSVLGTYHSAFHTISMGNDDIVIKSCCKGY
jgi:hypothetical protein